MSHQPDDPGPLADVEVDHGDAGTPVPPWVILGVVLSALAALLAWALR